MLIALLLTAIVAASSYLLVRNSSLVAVEEVKIVGLEGYGLRVIAPGHHRRIAAGSHSAGRAGRGSDGPER